MSKKIRFFKVENMVLITYLVLSQIGMFLLPYSLDDIWVYSFSHYINKGLKMYVDFNAVITPLSAYFYAIPLMIKDNFDIYLIGGLLTNVLIFFLYFKIFGVLGFDKWKRVVAVILIFTIFPFMFKTNYNILVGAICLVCIYLFLDIIKENMLFNSYCVILGMLSAISVFVKQSTGLLITASCCIVGLILSLKYDKNKVFVIVRKCGLFVAGFAAMSLSTMLLLSGFGIPKESIDVIFTSQAFMQNTDTMKIGIMIISIMTASCIYMTVKLIRRTGNMMYFVLLVFQMFVGISVYPLPNFGHFLMTNFAGFMILFCYFKKFGNDIKESFIKSAVPFDFIIMLLPLLVLLISSNLVPNIINMNKPSVSECEHMYANLDEHADVVNDYINEHEADKFYIINEIATLCNMRNDDRYNKYYDLMFEGNIGNKNAVDLIKTADCDYFIVTAKREDTFWQYNIDAINLIYDMEHVDDIYCDNGVSFSVYRNAYKQY